MAIYRLGSHGEEVRKIQSRLAANDLYRGAIDGSFGGGTHAAVMAFQKAHGLDADGIVGSLTWDALFNTSIVEPQALSDDLARRCLALTGAFETGTGFPDCFCGISGDFDGQGISFGVLQWNFGQGSLQPLLKEMLQEHPDVVAGIFGPHADALRLALDSGPEELMSFSRSVQHPVKHTVFEPWRGYAKALGRTTQFQDIQTRHAQDKFHKAVAMCGDYGLWSERAVALMFDIVVQNGSINSVVRAQIQGETRLLSASLSDAEREVKVMEIVANRRAQAANLRWVDDVRARKLCIARGEGTVHGITYDLKSQFGISLERFTS